MFTARFTALKIRRGDLAGFENRRSRVFVASDHVQQANNFAFKVILTSADGERESFGAWILNSERSVLAS